MESEKPRVRLVLPANTAAWDFQAWAAFAISALALGIGIYHAPVTAGVKPFLFMGMFFTIGSTFTLAKTMRDNRDRRVDTQAWIFQSWAAFLIANTVTLGGIFWMSGQLDRWVQAFLGVSFVFCVSSTFVLSKTVRDQHESASHGAESREA